MQTVRLFDPTRVSAAPSRSARPKLLAATIASLALLAGGCGSSSQPISNIGSPASFTAAAFNFSRCMRAHGLPSFPDPAMTDHDGQQVAYLTATVPARPSSAFKLAQSACRWILPAPINASPTQRAQQQHTREQHLLAFAKCVRDHGVSDFPDPTSQGQLTVEMVNAAGVDLHTPAVLAAARDCIAVTGGEITGADVQRAIDGTQ